MVTSWFFPEQVLDLIVLLRGLANFLIFLNDGFCIFKKEIMLIHVLFSSEIKWDNAYNYDTE